MLIANRGFSKKSHEKLWCNYNRITTLKFSRFLSNVSFNWFSQWFHFFPLYVGIPEVLKSRGTGRSQVYFFSTQHWDKTQKPSRPKTWGLQTQPCHTRATHDTASATASAWFPESEGQAWLTGMVTRVTPVPNSGPRRGHSGHTVTYFLQCMWTLHFNSTN